jgi:hypothetical protein
MTAWTDANHARVLAGLAEVRAHLSARIAGERAGTAAREAGHNERAAIDAMPQPAALDRLVETLRLSSFEQRLLLLCAGVELDSSLGRLCAEAQGGRDLTHPTFSLALAALPDAHWSAISPSSPLRHWKLIEVEPGPGLVDAPLRIDERVLHHIVGVRTQDERLAPVVRAVPPPAFVSPGHRALAEHVVRLFHAAADGVPVVELSGSDQAACRAVAALAADALGAPLFATTAADLPASPAERDLLCVLWEREFLLEGTLLLVEPHDAERDTLRHAAAFVDGLKAPVLLSGREPLRLNRRTRVRLDVVEPSSPERAELLRAALGGDAKSLDGRIEIALQQFHLGLDGMRAAAVQVRAALAEGGTWSSQLLWQACRVQARPRLEDLAERIEPRATFDDLVLPSAQYDVLRQIIAAVGARARVNDDWGFAARTRGLGVSALFAGASGTGKTLAAEVLANAVELDLYRIDLSQVVSKYIGETEKNLARVFDAAEEGGAVLLFDEADALFGRRTEVKDSHDRYANVETSYLLQRMEAYRGLAILTTNMKAALDPAFLRRIRFVLQFPFPDSTARAEIWRRVFPGATPVSELVPERLARLSIPGGNIHNIALNAAYLAAAQDAPVSMQHILRATRSEYAKLERPLTDAEVAGW